MRCIQFTLILFIISFLFSCSGEESFIWESEKSETYGCIDTIMLKDIYHTLSDVIEIENIDSVKMSNINGTFFLSQMQLKKFKKEISTMEYEDNFSAKVGSVRVYLHLKDRIYILTGSTEGKLVSFNSMKGKEKYHDYYFKLNGINFNNYKP